MERIIGIPFQTDDSCVLTARPDSVPVIAVTKGSLHVRSEQIDGTLFHGQLLFFPPESGAYSLTAPEASECMLLLLQGQLAKTTLENHFREHRQFCPSGLSDVLETVHALKEADGRQEEISVAAYTLLMRLYGAAQHYEQTSGYPALVDAAIGIMQEEFAQIYGVDEVAERLGITAAYLTRLFSKNVGMPPGRFLRLQKIACAKKLLTQPDMTVSLTAQLVGFTDVHYFSRVFRKETGMLPSAYRQSHAADPSEDEDIKRMLDTLYL
ncbi:MAG: AraC family transcriptional regulator [Eubacteriales bacterium]|nr:AraC family transcriptional regulator [Eubacteriales bacterium]